MRKRLVLNQETTVKSLFMPIVLIFFSTIQASPAPSEPNSANYNFLVASGYICNSNGACPAAARAANGDTVEISGAGTLNPSNHTVVATGTFALKNPAGEILETGIWQATQLLKFYSYGIAPGALFRDKRRVKKSLMFSMRLLTGPLPAGGLALFRIQLLPDSGRPKDAILQVNCALGKVPANQQKDGVRLAIEGNGLKFDQKVSGRTMFMLRKPGLNLSLQSEN